MKKLIVLNTALFILAFGLNAWAQLPGAPPGASDKNLDDRNIKDRSIEMERVKRDADKDASRPDKNPELNFAQIKEDFEQLQMVFDRDIVGTYQKSNPINYKQISAGSDEIKTRATRLRSNLFPQVKQKKSKEKKEETAPPATAPPATDMKSLIMSLNGSISSFVASPIFQNAKVIDPQDSEKARLDLESIIAKSAMLSEEAGKRK
jgi:hypothetical protein